MTVKHFYGTRLVETGIVMLERENQPPQTVATMLESVNLFYVYNLDPLVRKCTS